MSRNQRDIRFATFNLYNLQLPGKPTYPNSAPYGEDQYRAKIEWTAKSLAALDADVISFQELWSKECLIDAFKRASEPPFGLEGEYEFAFILDRPWDGIAVAAAVRKPWLIRSQQRHKAFPPEFILKKRDKSMAEIREDATAADLEDDEDGLLLPSHEDDAIKVKISEFSRSPLEVVIGHEKVPEVPEIAVFSAHLKSKRPSRLDIQEWRDEAIRPHKNTLGAAISTIRRTAEAAALRVILNKRMKDNHRPTVVLGDLNDGQLSNTLAILSDQPTYRLYSDSTAAHRNDLGLFTAANLQQLRSLKDIYYTHEFKGVQEVIDHVMVSEQFYDHSNNRHWSFREMKVLNDHIEDKDRATSDHGTVVVEFDWNPFTSTGSS